MATNPDRVLRPTAEQLAADQARAQQLAQLESLRATGRAKMRELVNTRAATFEELNSIALAHGMEPLDKASTEIALAWAANPENDPALIPINVAVSQTETAAAPAAEVSILAPQPAATTPQPTAGQAAAQAFREFYANEPIGLDPETLRQFGAEPGNLQGPMGLLNSIILAPVSAGTAALELLQAGTRAGFAGLGQGLQNIDLGGRSALQRLGDIAMPGVVASPQNFSENLGEFSDIAGLLAGGSPMAPLMRGPTPVSSGRMAVALERQRPAPLNLAEAVTGRPIRIAEVAADTTPPLAPSAVRIATAVPDKSPITPRAAAVAPEIPPAPARAAAPEVPPVPVDAPPVERAAAIDNIQPGTAPFLATPESRASAMQTLVDVGETQPIISHDLNKRFSAFAADYLNAANLARPADIPFTEFFHQHIAAETLPLEEVQALARKHNLSELDIVQATTGYRVSANEWGRIGQTLSMASRLVPTEMGDLARSMGSAPPPSLWRRIGNTQRGLLVSQLATTMRNNLSSIARVGIDVATGAADTAINAALNPLRRVTGRETVVVDPFNAFRMITQQFNPAQNRNVYRQLRNANAKINKELMATYNADIYRSAQKDKFSRVENAVEVLNTFNRVSEQFTRKAVFPVYLRRAYNRGSGVVLDGRRMSFDELANGNQLHLIPEDTFQRALNDTLDFTYSRQPKQDSAVDLFIRGIEKTGPIGATLVPFPRFMLNAARFQYEFSPASLLQVMFSPKQWRAIASGDTELLNRGIVGSMLLYAAYEFQNSQYAGSKWYMARTEDGNEVDLRPYFPAPFYLFLADVIKRYQDRTLDQAYTGADIVQGLTGAQFRAGAGLYAIDEAMRDLTGAGGKSFPESATTVVGNILANTGSAWLTPLGQFKDFVAEFDQGEAVRRDAQGSMLGTLLRTVPFAQQALGIPEQTYTTREGGLATQHPFLRQLLGATITPTNRLELELRQLGIVPSDLYSPEGIPGIDRRQRELIGMIASRNADQYLFTPEYAAANKIDQTDMVQNFYKEVRAAAREVLRAENPAVDMIVRFQDLDRENKIRVNEQYEEVHGQTFLEYMGNLSEQLMEAPLVSTQEEYNALPSGAKYTDPGDMKVYTKE